MSKQTMTKSQLREAINGLGPLAPDWLVEALEDFIELQEAHKNLLAIHAEDAYHLDEARAKLQAPAIDERAEFEKWANENKGGETLQLGGGGTYPNPFANAAFEAWQARAKLSALEVVSKTTDTVVPDEKSELAVNSAYAKGWNDCRAVMLKGEMTLGELLKAKRNAAKFTLEELSELADVSKSYLHAIESGESCPSIYICTKLSLALGVSLQSMALAVIKNSVESKTSEPENV